MIFTVEAPYLYRAFGARVEAALQVLGVPHTLERGRDFYHLDLPARDPGGFPIHLNVGPQRAYLILAREAAFEFSADSEAAAADVADKVLELVRQLAGPGGRVRVRKAGGTAYAWQIEFRRGRDWHVAHEGRTWLFNYFGRRHEVVLKNP